MKNLLIKALLTVLLCAFTQASFAKDWSLYDSYVKLHYQNGKVLSEGGAVESKAQVLFMFLTLSQNDKASFDKLYAFTKAKLQKEQALVISKVENDTVTDNSINTLTNLFLAYDLICASELFNDSKYLTEAKAILASVKAQCTSTNALFGKVLTPYANRANSELLTLNSSTYAPFVLQKITTVDEDFRELYFGSIKAVIKASGLGYVPDQLKFNQSGDFIIDKNTKAYLEAMNFYLWLSISSKSDPNRRLLLPTFENLINQTQKGLKTPLKVDFYTQEIFKQNALISISSLLNICDYKVKDYLRSQIKAHKFSKAENYEHLAALFATGIDELRFAFTSDGSLLIGN